MVAMSLLKSSSTILCCKNPTFEQCITVDSNAFPQLPEVMGPHCLISEEEVAAAIKGLKIGKAAGSTGVMS